MKLTWDKSATESIWHCRRLPFCEVRRELGSPLKWLAVLEGQVVGMAYLELANTIVVSGNAEFEQYFNGGG
jgi:hypothetical protein